MIKKLLHTPEGVRDIYNSECERKLQLQNSLHHVLKLHGFKDIQTPSFEFFDIFSKERGTVASKDMYKFFDRDGNTLVLRPDITPSIARCAAKYYKDEEFPIRLCYMGSTFINNSSYQGKLKEVTQLGAELMNDDSVDADAQMIAMTIECLKIAGLQEFQVEIGEADFFRGLVDEAGFDEEEETGLRLLIEKKNMFGVEDMILNKNISTELKNVFLTLPELFGTQDKLAYAKTLTKNERALRAIERLEQIYSILSMYGLEKYITFDLGMLSKYNYYTGIIFRAYTYGTGDTIAGGGRYDNLVGQFGKNAPAIGLAILVDQLMIALSRQKIEMKPEENNTLILYKSELLENAIILANHFRSSGMNIELLRENPSHTLNDYIEYSKRGGIGGMLYYESKELIKVIHAESGEIQEAKIEDFMK
jgi:ATP phosphoribosyltransferase regulatory subunit